MEGQVPVFISPRKRVAQFEIASKYLNFLFVPHRKHCASITKTNRIMLSGKLTAVYCENHMKHINREHYVGKMLRFWMLKLVVHLVTNVIVWSLRYQTGLLTDHSLGRPAQPIGVTSAGTSVCVTNLLKSPSRMILAEV
jgi:hypothetical protein